MSEMTGRGLTFPLSLGVAGLSDSAGPAKVEQSIKLILGTLPGERLMRPDFGCRLRTLAFAPNSPATADLARYYVSDSLARWEPRIDVLDVQATNDPNEGALVIDIHYRLSTAAGGSAARAAGGAGAQTLTYPFSLGGSR